MGGEREEGEETTAKPAVRRAVPLSHRRPPRACGGPHAGWRLTWSFLWEEPQQGYRVRGDP